MMLAQIWHDVKTSKFFMLGLLVGSVIGVCAGRPWTRQVVNAGYCIGFYFAGVVIAHLLILIVAGRDEWRAWLQNRIRR